MNAERASVRAESEWMEQLASETVETFDQPLDAGIAQAVVLLREAGVETFESCEGGNGHAYTEPTIRFHGDRSEGYRAVAAAIQAGLNVAELRRTWPIQDGELTGPWWELTFVEDIVPTRVSHLPTAPAR